VVEASDRFEQGVAAGAVSKRSISTPAARTVDPMLDLASNAAQCHRFVPASRRGAGLRQSFQDRYFLPAPRRPVSDLTGIPRSNAGSARL